MSRRARAAARAFLAFTLAAARAAHDPVRGAAVSARARRVTITLSAAQRDHVVRAASGAGNLEGMLAGLGGIGQMFARASGLVDEARLSRSLVIGLYLLASLASADWCALSEIAARAGLSTSTTHRYVATLVAVGLVEQDPESRRYRRIDASQAVGGGR